MNSPEDLNFVLGKIRVLRPAGFSDAKLSGEDQSGYLRSCLFNWVSTINPHNKVLIIAFNAEL